MPWEKNSHEREISKPCFHGPIEAVRGLKLLHHTFHQGLSLLFASPWAVGAAVPAPFELKALRLSVERSSLTRLLVALVTS